MQYKLINLKAKEKNICDKVVIDGFDYYVNDYISDEVDGDLTKIPFEKLILITVATNNPNIDVPQIINQVESLAEEWVFETNKEKWSNNNDTAGDNFGSYKAGYQKSQETHPFSLEDMIEFAKWIANTRLHGFSKQLYEAMLVNKVETIEELIEIWDNQRLKTIYYE